MHTSTSKDFPSDLYPDRLGYPVTCIGAGGIGSALIPLVVRAGVQRLDVWDDDKVEPINLQMQNFYEAELGRYKAVVLARRAVKINAKLHVNMHVRRFTHLDVLDGIVLSAVDSIQSRRVIFEALQRQTERVALLVDGRLTRRGDYIDLYFIDPRSRVEMENYEASLFDPSCALRTPRTDSMTAHVPYMLSGLIGEALSDWAKDRSHPWKVTYDATVHEAVRYHA